METSNDVQRCSQVHNDCHEMKSKNSDLLKGENHSEAWLLENTKPHSFPKQTLWDEGREGSGRGGGRFGRLWRFSLNLALLSQPHLLTTMLSSGRRAGVRPPALSHLGWEKEYVARSRAPEDNKLVAHGLHLCGWLLRSQGQRDSSPKSHKACVSHSSLAGLGACALFSALPVGSTFVCCQPGGRPASLESGLH